ncbi:MAG: NAD-dependent succinate-semialdehyde dehydrogenase [Planctomycetes bacterium]|nr:NAD-dependent succinate-semialdehyde dehydrogenase [Planctomycetota bacterium]
MNSAAGDGAGIQTLNWINGKWTGADGGATFAVRNPATREEIARVPDCGPAEARRALDAAAAAFPAWAALPALDRANILFNVYAQMLSQARELAMLLTVENGKPIKESLAEIQYAADFVRWSAEEARRVYGETIPASVVGKRHLVLKQPLGVVAAITPWNFPSAMITRKVAPALAAGCTVVIKPAEQTPLSALALAELFAAAKLPPGVLNVITGNPEPIAKEMLSHAKVRKIAFTGSTEVGKILMRGAADGLKRVALELGGHAPFIVFADADLDKAAEGCVTNKFRNSGQTCICANRVYVQQEAHDAFVKKLVERASALVVGDGLDEKTQIGPMIDEQGLKKVVEHLEDARKRGAKVLCGGRVKDERWYEPTVLTNVPPESRILHEETFGPVAPVVPFKTEDEVVRLANDTPYGLAAYFYTKDVSRLFRVAEALEYGIVGANDPSPGVPQAPFGGMKESGMGREGGKWGLEEYVEVKHVSIGI